MSIEQLVILILVGSVAGWLASLIMKKGKSSLLVNIILGVLGSFLGRWAFGLLQIHASGLLGLFIMATVGAMAILFLARLFVK
ncbi:MAG: GlsB/YeaQ/YmgE family stress response membrane protein [Acidobacteria bacterium]|nr:GlsB/YeaQ/YmgE family stress response membrane protein [Acidobacteriota bacterium]